MTTEAAEKVVNMPDKIYTSVEEMMADGASEVEYRTIDGFKTGTKIRIGTVDAAHMMAWSEANEGPAKKSAGLRLIISSLVGPEPDNKRIGKDSDLQLLQKFRHSVTERILREIVNLNGLTAKDDKAAKND